MNTSFHTGFFRNLTRGSSMKWKYGSIREDLSERMGINRISLPALYPPEVTLAYILLNKMKCGYYMRRAIEIKSMEYMKHECKISGVAWFKVKKRNGNDKGNVKEYNGYNQCIKVAWLIVRFRKKRGKVVIIFRGKLVGNERPQFSG